MAYDRSPPRIEIRSELPACSNAPSSARRWPFQGSVGHKADASVAAVHMELAVICGCGAVGSQCQPFQAGRLIVRDPQAFANLQKCRKSIAQLLVHHGLIELGI
jgi:hypothetical protein